MACLHGVEERRDPNQTRNQSRGGGAKVNVYFAVGFLLY